MTDWSSKLGEWAGALPGVQYIADGVSRGTVTHLLGFWLCWNIYGGHDAMVKAGWAQSSVYRSRALFRRVMGCEVEDFMPVHAEMLRAADKLVSRYGKPGE